MSFNFSWPAFSAEFYENAIQTLNTALNRGQKPKAIVDDIVVQSLHMGTVPPELEILEIGDLSRDRFRGIFRFVYAGDAHLEMSTGVQANPLARNTEDMGLFVSPATSRGMLFAARPLTVPMRIKLSEVRLRAIVVLVVSRTKGITLVFKNDPLESVKVSSTFDSVGVIQKYLQEEIETQLREMFRDDLPTIIHRLSQDWLRTSMDTPPSAPPAATSAPPPTERNLEADTMPSLDAWAQASRLEDPLGLLSLDDTALPTSVPSLTRLALSQSSRGLKDLIEPTTSSSSASSTPIRRRTIHTAGRVRTPMKVGTSTPSTPRTPAMPMGLDLSAHLAELLRANHTLSPYTPNPRLIALRTAPMPRQRKVRMHARQKRVFHLS